MGGPATLVRYAGLITFLISYLFLVVLGNLLYFSPFGNDLGQQTIREFSINNFYQAGSVGYWLLLFLPFLAVPAIAICVAKVAAPGAKLIAKLPCLSKIEYTALMVCGYAFSGWSLWGANAVGLLLRGRDFEGAVRDRFDLLNALGFWPLAVIKSVLFALSCYGLIRTLTSRDRFWTAAAAFNLVAMSFVLLLLNMKWPLVLFYVAHLIGILLFANRKLIPSIVFIALAGTSYFSTSMLLLRATGIADSPVQATREVHDHKPAHREPAQTVAVLALGAVLNRMAQPFPYYYEMFTREPGKCGSLLTRVLREPSPCQPSIVVYAKMFPGVFAGTGTSPQPAHVTGFALSGWIGALIEMIAVATALGLFAAIAGGASSWQATITVLGALTGYYFSQLPFEGAFVYDHGILWWALIILGLLAVRRFQHRQTVSANGVVA